MPNGYELETPSFGYWVKAGIAFTLGAGITAIVGGLLWGLIALRALGEILRAFTR